MPLTGAHALLSLHALLILLLGQEALVMTPNDIGLPSCLLHALLCSRMLVSVAVRGLVTPLPDVSAAADS